MKYMLIGLVLAFDITAAFAHTEAEIKMYTIAKKKVSLVEKDPFGFELRRKISEREYYELPMIQQDDTGKASPIDNAGKVIGVAKDLVALGEDIYALVIKGKPNIATEYAPISVIPKVNGQPADVFETENWSMPSSYTYDITYENGFGMDVVKFTYSVIFMHGGTYNGKGKYLTGVQIVPTEAWAFFGYDFSAKMKLGGISNHGTRENPIAGATLLIEHEVKTIVKATVETNVHAVTGAGVIKKVR